MLGAAGGLLHLLGVGGYRTGLLGVLVPLGVLTGATAWLALGRRHDRGLWTVASIVIAGTVAGVVTGTAPPSRGVLLADARSLLPPFYEEVGHETSGHSWCRPDCPMATLEVDPPGTGAPAVMLELATPFLDRGLLSAEDLAAITRRRDFDVRAPDRTYRVALQGEGDERRLRITAAAL